MADLETLLEAGLQPPFTPQTPDVDVIRRRGRARRRRRTAVAAASVVAAVAMVTYLPSLLLRSPAPVIEPAGPSPGGEVIQQSDPAVPTTERPGSDDDANPRQTPTTDAALGSMPTEHPAATPASPEASSAPEPNAAPTEPDRTPSPQAKPGEGTSYVTMYVTWDDGQAVEAFRTRLDGVQEGGAGPLMCTDGRCDYFNMPAGEYVWHVSHPDATQEVHRAVVVPGQGQRLEFEIVLTRRQP